MTVALEQTKTRKGGPILGSRSYYINRPYEQEEMRSLAISDLGNLEFDTVVGSGVSGTLAASRLSDWFDCHFLIIRKPRDRSHSGQMCEGMLGKRWLFVDDFTSTGSTFRRVFGEVAQLIRKQRWETEFIGAWLCENHTRRFQDAAHMSLNLHENDIELNASGNVVVELPEPEPIRFESLGVW